ncbi:MAG: DNA alkylation repair protein [Flavobacteriia bacterium]|nr:DNA alkylation repair protein [Flavobacteriia bacterium]
MSFELKNIYSISFFEQYLKDFNKVLPIISKKDFFSLIFNDKWDSFELKQRMSHIAQTLTVLLPEKYDDAIETIKEIITVHQKKGNNGFNFEYMFYPEFVILNGQNHFKTSISAMENITQFTSCEFAVRHFFQKDFNPMMKQMQEWTNHTHPYVRRLSSEGSRTRLPWAIKVPDLFKHPDKILTLLEKLHNDENEWVRKSVANNLNDLSKDFPEQVLQFTKQKLTHSNKNSVQLFKHANRTLLKKGNEKALSFFGFNKNTQIEVKSFTINNPKMVVVVGQNLEFELELKNTENSNQQIRIEYLIHFLRKDGTHFCKVFQWKQFFLGANESCQLKKFHSFKKISTRNYASGTHFLSLQINGNECFKSDFSLFDS